MPIMRTWYIAFFLFGLSIGKSEGSALLTHRKNILFVNGTRDCLSNSEFQKNQYFISTCIRNEVPEGLLSNDLSYSDKNIEINQASIIQLPLFNAGWFTFISIAFILLLSYFFHRYRLRKMKARKDHEVTLRSTQLKDQFLANMSHEFRTPLNAIMGMTRLMRDNNPNPDHINYINAILRSTENLNRIINDILDISKIEAGRIHLEKIPFDIRIILQGIYDNFYLDAREKELEFEVNSADNLQPLLIGDPLRLTQILSNLVGNAIKFTESGKVQLYCSAHQTENFPNNIFSYNFIVKDTGIGISTDKREIIFESFSQENNDTTRKFGGQGLGLSIVKKLVDLSEGSLEVESAPEKGTTFYISIPFELYEGEPLVKNESVSSQSLRDALKGISILLVEDIEFNRIVALDTLTTEIADVKVDVATNGNEAVALCSQNSYDAILMDLQMPFLNGYDASKQIRKLPKPYSEVPIIAMTASALQDEISRCYDAGMNDFITKPFSTEVLFRKILNQRRQQLQNV